MILALLLILCGPHTSTVTLVDQIERNHVVDQCGRDRFVQYIFWSEHRGLGRIHVTAYRVDNKDVQEVHHGKLTSIHYFDGQRNRQVTSSNFKETWTNHDPERDDRLSVPESERQGL